MNKNLLRGKIAEKGYNQKLLAEKVGMSSNSLSRKISGKREFTLSEMISICKVLEIDDPKAIFFNR
ncbi:helix-turn-helix domain-containing protein [Senimuribacter intestinalis]|uniref:helix-turn-helix domain-containing protein n=1 Tax=Senimuribacter intestinalis TaxID=2941507 RepID=UPI00203A54CC|nr:helix-turn-helix transcriptional regulator [Senimuribacter intestinalis]